MTYHLASETPALGAPAARVHLLPGFDEYLLGYGDRSAALAPEHSQAIVPGGNGMFKPTIVVDGEVVGTWRRIMTTREIVIEPVPFARLRGTAQGGAHEGGSSLRGLHRPAGATRGPGLRQSRGAENPVVLRWFAHARTPYGPVIEAQRRSHTMLDLAPPADLVQPPPGVDRTADELGRAFIDAIVAGDFDRLETMLAPDVRFRAIIPDEYQEASTAPDARALVEDWFGETDRRLLLGSTIAPVGDRLALGYRLELTEDGERRVVEQHVAATVAGATFSDLAVVCSGFRPLAPDPERAAGTLHAAGLPNAGGADAPAPEPAARLDAIGLSCATLTPTIRSAIQELDFGAVLEIVTDDPEAEAGLRSWTRLTGNELVSTQAGPGSASRYGIRRTPRRAAPTQHGGTE